MFLICILKNHPSERINYYQNSSSADAYKGYKHRKTDTGNY